MAAYHSAETGWQAPVRSRIHIAITQEKVRRIVHRFNQQCLKGLERGTSPGAPRKLTGEQESDLRQRILKGPQKKDEVSVFHGPDIQRIVQEDYGIAYKDRSIYPVLHRLGLSHQDPRPKHPKGDAAKQAALKKRVPGTGSRSSK
jgi:putative transposase